MSHWESRLATALPNGDRSLAVTDFVVTYFSETTDLTGLEEVR